MNKINEREIKELVNDIPNLQKYFPNILTISTNNKTVHKKKIRLKINKKNSKLLFKNNNSFSLKENEKIKQQ